MNRWYRLSAVGAAAALALLLGEGRPTSAQEATVSLKGRVQGGETLLNPVWNESKETASHRYTFRAPSTTVSARVRDSLSAYLPKELCIVALSAGTAAAKGTPVPVHVSGGRTTPVTLVVPEGQNVQFINDDPFPHVLYDVAGAQGGLGPEETDEKKQRTWKPPKTGVYEIRDKNFPSLRSWIVVETRAAAAAHPNTRNEFTLAGLTAGDYELRGYHNGKPVGDPLKVSVRATPDVQDVRDPLVVGSAKSAAETKEKK